MTHRSIGQHERTLEVAQAFVSEVRRDLERAAADGTDIPPRLRTVHSRAGHSTPEYRTLAIPIPPGATGASPEILSGLIAKYAAAKPPCCLVLVLDCTLAGEDGQPRPVLIAEAHDLWGTRLFLMQPFRVDGGVVRWEEPVAGGWQDPGEEEMILDGAFTTLAPEAR